MRTQDIIDRARGEIGVTEYPPNSNDVKYNSWFYGRAVSGSAYPWCCAFISWLFRDTELVKKTASCQDLLQWFEARGQIVTKAQAGDLVFFKYSTNNRRTNHIGLVIGVKGNMIATIEGNTSISSDDNGGAVMERMRSSKVVAYARPNYDDAYKTIRKGDTGIFVKKLQHILNTKYGFKLVEDGDYGNNTFNAVVATQGAIGVYNGQMLVKDGIVGDKTWRAILKI